MGYSAEDHNRVPLYEIEATIHTGLLQNWTEDWKRLLGGQVSIAAGHSDGGSELA